MNDFERCIADGGVALFPADTVYGLACDPESREAVERLYAIKGRPAAQEGRFALRDNSGVGRGWKHDGADRLLAA